MFDDGALAISAPAAELNALPLPGSLFSAADIAAAPLSPALRLAVDLLLGACRQAGFQPTFVARPEIFTHGEALAWLKARLNGVRHHVALSDGTTARLIPGLDNHVFFFGLHRAADDAALTRLARRAPELIGQLRSQINTALEFADGVAPLPVAVTGADASEPPPPAFYRLALNLDSVDDSLTRTMRSGPLPRLPGRFAEIDYVALTETSLADAGFLATLAAKLSHAYFEPRRALALRLPMNARSSLDVDDRAEAALAALIASEPRAPIAAAPGAFFVDGDLAPDRLAAFAPVVDFAAPDSFPFWVHAPARYRAARTVTVHARARLAAAADFAPLVEALTGRPCALVRDPSARAVSQRTES